MARNNKGTVWFDGLLILLNIINGGLSVLPMILLFDSIPLNLLLGIILNFIWFIFNSPYLNIRRIPNTLIPYFIILGYQILLGRLEYSIAVFLVNLSFFFVLSAFLNKYKDDSIRYLTNTYCAYSLVNVIGVVLAFLLITFGVLNPFSNELNVSILTKDNELAFFPGCLSVIRPFDGIRVSFLQVPALFCGFSHEPHVVGYICLPAFFYFLYKMKYSNSIRKYFIITLYVLFFLITLSATSFISVLLVTTVGLLFSSSIKGSRKNIAVLFLLVILAFLAVSFIQESFSFVFDKINAEEGSRSYSEDRIIYALTPKSLIGNTIYSTSIDGDIGIITAILNLSFYFSMGFLCFKLLKAQNKTMLYAGMAFLYFLSHSMKAFLMIYRYPFTLFMVFLTYVIYKAYEDQEIDSIC